MKYVIACNDQEKDNNYKYITKKYYRNVKSKGLIENIISAFQSLRLSEPYYIFSEKLCELFIKELELFYLNNNFYRRSLQVRKAYLTKKNERYHGIVLPIFLSLIASIIYGIVSGNVFRKLIEIINSFYNLSVQFFCFVREDVEYDHIEIYKLYAELVIIVICFIAIVTPLIVWATIKIICIIAALFGGTNFSIITIRQYEIDYLEKLALSDEYFSIAKEIDTYSNQFSDVINSLVYNTVIKNGYALTENIIDELKEKLIINPIIDQNDIFSTDLFEKQIIVKSIICRVLLRMNDKKSRLLLKRSKIILKKSEKHKEESCYE